MKKLIAIACLILPMHIYAEAELTFSSHSANLQLQSVDNNLNASFSGNIQITGVLHVDFFGPNDAANGAYFLPDSISLKKLPNVTSGGYIKTVRQIYIGEGAAILAQAVGKRRATNILQGKKKHFLSKGVATIRSYKTQVVCDSRQYTAEVISIRLFENERVFETKLENGC